MDTNSHTPSDGLYGLDGLDALLDGETLRASPTVNATIPPAQATAPESSYVRYAYAASDDLIRPPDRPIKSLKRPPNKRD